MQLLLALASIIRTPRRFAVDGYHSSDLLIQALYPTEKALLKLMRVDAGKDAPVIESLGFITSEKLDDILSTYKAGRQHA